MVYIATTGDDRLEMLKTVGVNSIGELFSDIPQEMKLQRMLDIPAALTEPELIRHCKRLAEENCNTTQITSFLGAGLYEHFIPSAVHHLIGRSEFYTSYTPYQAEVSQGMLQAIYEYQTLVCQLTGMDVANASVYDAGTGIVEAVAVARAATRKDHVLFADTVHPDHLAVCKTYAEGQDWSLSLLANENGVVALDALESALEQGVAAVVIQQPNFYGVIEDLGKVSELAHRHGALVIVCVDPILMALLKSPGECGVDIVVGEGQAMGNPMHFGGPTLGFFAVTDKQMRRIPGRVVGKTADAEGNRGFVLTLQAREQHIRRQRATSNICSNQALNALASAIYLAMMGPKGLKDVALQSVQKAHYLKEKLEAAGLGRTVFSSPFGAEFLFSVSGDFDAVWNGTLARGIVPGLPVSSLPGLPETMGQVVKDTLLISVTETKTRSQLDSLVDVWKGLTQRG